MQAPDYPINQVQESGAWQIAEDRIEQWQGPVPEKDVEEILSRHSIRVPVSYNGVQMCTVHADLAPFANSVREEFERLSSLEDDWDGEGSDAPPKDLLAPAMKFLLRYAEATFKEGFGAKKIHVPYITLRENGTVDFLWRANGFRMLMNFHSIGDKNKVTYFGIDPDGTEFGENTIPTEVPPFPYLAVWLKNLAI